jgi:hypothetical protein
VRAAWPAAGAALSSLQVLLQTLNVLSPGFRFFDGKNPADPLVAREWSDVFPFFSHGCVRKKNFA